MVISTITSPRSQSNGSWRPTSAGTATGGDDVTAIGSALKRTSGKRCVGWNVLRSGVPHQYSLRWGRALQRAQDPPAGTPGAGQNMCRRIAMLATSPSERSTLSIDEPP